MIQGLMHILIVYSLVTFIYPVKFLFKHESTKERVEGLGFLALGSV